MMGTHRGRLLPSCRTRGSGGAGSYFHSPPFVVTCLLKRFANSRHWETATGAAANLKRTLPSQVFFAMYSARLCDSISEA
eukprot:2427834-Amphidinium_carterae.1